MSIIKPLPSWAIINRFPAFYEGESLTAIEQTARIYGKINELIETYNRFVTENNAELTELETQVQRDLACAIRTIINLTDSYITQVELRLTHQDRKLDEQYKALTDDITNTVDEVIQQMKEAGELDQVILDAIGNLNTKFDSLQTNVAEEQAALKADYEAAKAALEAEYTDTLDSINGFVTNKMEEFEQNAESLNAELKEDVSKSLLFMEQHSDVVYLPDDSYQLANFVGQAIPNIKNYSIVRVFLISGQDVLCHVEKTGTGTYHIYGFGGQDFDFTSGSLTFTCVDITLSSECVVTTSNCGYMWVSPTSITGDKVDEIASIVGLVPVNPDIS